ncbi:3-hydroxyisobutyrate dehydrogenase [Deinobacterium chartae]|uniref:3-hydroxyisobutyrate dehydrogenase n=1 Tax=Deinobacterium chartae TaxID=521158 RepID=A0A841I2R2_9DEIO|nr:NAD(P)-dependent oxidoreductase [Deinobacterium chartae]MBB6099563.1 3-hydroxyisobutyrate dehydrogenase [Deinobacterium chartae]
MNVSYIGLGAMGYPMAGHIARHFSTGVWNRTAAKADAHAAEHGSRVLGSVREAAEADLLITCLPTSLEVEALLPEVLSGARAGLIWMDCTSGDPVASQRIAAKLAEHGVRFLDAPLSGGTAGAQAGRMSVMVGGSEELLAQVRPVLQTCASTIVRVGDVGAGHAVKAINNMLLAVNLWAAGEGLAALAATGGIDLRAALEVINASSGRSNVTENLIPQRVLTREFPATFALGLLAKDAGIALDLSRAAGCASPAFALIESLYRAAKREVGAEVDHTAVVRYIERLAGTEVRA